MRERKNRQHIIKENNRKTTMGKIINEGKNVNQKDRLANVEECQWGKEKIGGKENQWRKMNNQGISESIVGKKRKG